MKRSLTAKVVLVFAAALLAITVGAPARAGIPVLDYSNLVQNIAAVIQRIQQMRELSDQTDQMKTQNQKLDAANQKLDDQNVKLDTANETLTGQLDQLQQQLAIAQQNLKTPEEFTWDDAAKTIDKLTDALVQLDKIQDTIENKAGFKPMAKYQSDEKYGKCLQEGGCDDKTWAAFQDSLKKTAVDANSAQWENNDAWIKSLQAHKASLTTDKDQLVQLQQKAAGAAGEMEALGYANEFASAQVNQLMQIRALLLAQQQAQAFNAQADVAKDARSSLTRVQQSTPATQMAADEAGTSTNTASAEIPPKTFANPTN